MVRRNYKKILASLLTLCMVVGLLPMTAIAADNAPVTVREYHVTREADDVLETYARENGGVSGEFDHTNIRFYFNDGYSVGSAANLVAHTWSATPISTENHQPENLAAVELVFYRWIPAKIVRVTIPAEQLDITAYDTNGWLDFAEVSLKAEPEAPPEVTKVTVTFRENLPTGDAGEDYSSVELDKGVALGEDGMPEDPSFSGYTFEGWYEQGAESAYDYNAPVEDDITLYAKWLLVPATPLDAQFYFRLDRTIQLEDGKIQYSSTYYTPHDLMSGTVSGPANVAGGEDLVKDGVVANDDLKKLVETFADVQKVILTKPDDAVLKATMMKYFDITEEEITENKVGILWYVSKVIGNEKRLHVDGVVYNMESGKPVEPKATSYKLVHEYYTNHEKTGSTETEVPGIVLENVTIAQIAKVTIYGGETYQYTASVPTENLVLDASGTQIITLRYDRTVAPPEEPITHKVTFFVDGRQLGETQNVVDGENAVDPNYTAPAGFSFSGWDKGFTNVTTDLEIRGTTTAIPEIPEEPITHKVTFFVDGRQLGETQNVVDGGSAVDPNYTAPAGFSFSGWDKGFTNVTTALEIRGTTTAIPIIDPGPSYNYYSVTVRYLEEGTSAVLAPNYRTTGKIEGSAYDVSAQTTLAVDGYSIASVEGESTGRLNRNTTITVWYTADQVIIEPDVPMGNLPDLPNDITIDEGGTPLSDLPQLEQPLPENLPEGKSTDEVVIIDSDTPLGNLPQTGTQSRPVDTAWTLGLLALMASLSAVGLTITFSRRREEDAE